MQSAVNELLQAIHARFIGSHQLVAWIGPDGMRDRLVEGKRLPCIVIADVISNDNSTDHDTTQEHWLMLQVWSDGSGQKQAQDIASCIHELLHDADLPLQTHHLVSLQHRSTQARREPKTNLYSADMRFRAVTETI